MLCVKFECLCVQATEEESYTSTVVNSTDSEDDVEIYDSTGNLLSTSIVFKNEVYTYIFLKHCFVSIFEELV